MDRALVVWAAVTALAGCVLAQGKPIFVAPWIMEQQLVYDPAPVYPRLARQARISGAVRMAVWISADGDVEGIRLMSGHPLLVKAAMDAVRQWLYRPTAVWHGRPADVVTTVTVNFDLRSDGAPEQPGGEQTIVHASQRHRLAQ